MADPHEKPLYLGLYFIRDTKRMFDYNNACQIVTDLMQEYEWIEDDNCKHVVPVYMGSHVEPNNPGTAIFIIDAKDYMYMRDKYIVVQPKQGVLEL